MKKIKDFPFFFLLNPPLRKHLAIVPNPVLKKFDEAFYCLGSHIKNKARPCIFWKTTHEGNFYKIVFLTSSRFSPLEIDLSLCTEKTKRCPKLQFYPKSFLIFYYHKPFSITLKDPAEQLANLIYCGPCENLDELDEI